MTTKQRIFGTKSETLENLRPLVKVGTVLPQVTIKWDDWKSGKDNFLQRIKNELRSNSVIVRSSSYEEDGSEQSNAGKFRTILDVSCDNSEELQKAIVQVFDSYGDIKSEDIIFVQPMLKDISVSGVVFTRDLDSGAPYYIFNYDKTSRRTDTVTSGEGQSLQTLIHSRFSPDPPEDAELKSIYDVINELEKLCDSDELDIEFAVDGKGEVYVLQVRPLVISKNLKRLEDAEVEKYLKKIHHQIDRSQEEHPYRLGSGVMLGVMPDWNPAEIIGVRPRRLALSLYKELITDVVWSYQRNNYGYRNLRSFPLLVSLGGLPYIDVISSFNSFIPGDLSENIAEKMVDYYIRTIKSSPHWHDKIEFEIVFSCYSLDLNDRLEKLLEEGFSMWELGEIRSSLRRLTNQIIHPSSGIYISDKAKIRRLISRQKKIMKSNLDPLGKIYWLLEDCKRYGTLPFAGLARAAFIAVQFLNSFKTVGIMSTEDYDAFFRGVETVAKSMTSDVLKVQNKKLTTDKFLKKYGHLRPGTYDILSKRYDEAPEDYFNFKIESQDSNSEEQFEEWAPSEKQLQLMDRLLEEHGLEVTASELFQFIKDVIEEREYAKFVFTKSISDALRLIRELGENQGISEEDISYVDLLTITKSYSSMPIPDLKTVMLKDIELGKSQYRLTENLKLPPLIGGTDKIYSFYLEEGVPNYVTLKRVTAEVMADESFTGEDCEGKIIFIKNADPGYDWLFSHDISGLITMYGGANSHMAIRASELGIPAVIGCGEKLFRQWLVGKLLEIDAANKQVRILR